MTPTQEMCNALTMLAAPLLSLFIIPDIYVADAMSVSQRLFFLLTFLHAPFSVTFHLKCAFRKVAHSVDNDWCRLDISFILLVSTGWSYCITRSLIYTALCGCHLISSLRWVWSWSRITSTSPPNFFQHVCRQSILMLLGLIYTGQFRALLESCVLAAFMFSCFFLSQSPPLKGWGHSMFHLLAVPFWLNILYAIQHNDSLMHSTISEPSVAFHYGTVPNHTAVSLSHVYQF